ncbi:MAG TPA: alpha-amylase/4-alpha-glucanotransferase domain-containing protein, partial [Longimicrobiales bacterium]|nr:alpha-amylase/4-alpha-glucanotransferase domain-containing protein [Longimicrobiales bacterium]
PPSGRAYLPSASYREMEGWALPPAAVRALERGRDALAADPEAAERLHGGYWPSFLARYEESARMHAKAERLSRLCRAAGDPEPARLAVARAQCNDAYWHGVFGGLYLKHLRDAVWASLAEAERILRAGEGLAFEREQDGGTGAILVHSSRFAARVEPERGGRVVELTDLAMGVNLANVLTRRHESYHRVREPRAAAPARPVEASAEVTAGANGTEDPPPAVSIHETEARLGLEELPPVDAGPRALLLDRVLAEHVTERAYAAADYEPVWSWEDEPFEVTVERRMGALAIALRASGPFRLDKTLSFHEDGTLEVAYVWDPAAFPPGAHFAPELSLGVNPGEDPGIRFGPDLAGVWRHEIRTVSKSESGFEETYQGLSLTPLWPCAAGSARLVIPAGADRAAAAPSTPPTPPSPAR